MRLEILAHSAGVESDDANNATLLRRPCCRLSKMTSSKPSVGPGKFTFASIYSSSLWLAYNDVKESMATVSGYFYKRSRILFLKSRFFKNRELY